MIQNNTKFKPVAGTHNFSEMDARWLKHWQDEDVFKRSVNAREGNTPFVWYEGPPTANGMPHPGHVLTRVMKDLFLRYRTMCGYHAPRSGGWDTHGLPVEVEVEKDLGITGREAIENYGVEAFTRKCVDSVFRYIEEWKRMDNRIGFWCDLDKAYVTFHHSYVESVWWALSELFKKGLLYQGYKVLWWWPGGGTALSAGEVGQGYKTVDDPSVIVRFPVVDGSENGPRTSLLAWTTTPWTLPSNIALAVSPEQSYCKVELEDGERLIVAEALVGKVLKGKNFQTIQTMVGSDLVGLKYEPPFRYAEPEPGISFQVIPADFVTMDTGCGLVHIAPAFGEDDFRVAKEQGLGFLQLVKPDGTFCDEVSEFAGKFCKDADRDIIRHLRGRDLLFSEEVYRHEYPFSWRRDTDPLIQYARKSWFIRTTEMIDQVIENNQQVNWEPNHIKDGRFGSFLSSNVDWALSRERFWGTPLPIWINDVSGEMDVVPSVAEILERNPAAFDHFEEAKKNDPSLQDHLRVHKPWIDEVTWEKPGEPGVYRRVPEVTDCWFDSGCMPFAQWGYPHQNQEAFDKHYPADFITEAVDQTRGWFYSLIMVNSLMFPERANPHPYKNCLVLGLIGDEKGQKLSKSKKNYTDPLDMVSDHGADAVRWALYSNTMPGKPTRLFKGVAVDALRDYILKIWNVYSFFITYANIDGFAPSTPRPPISARSDMDRWILSELDSTIRTVRDGLDNFRSHQAARALDEFVDALSNWYVRRSRSRFWAEGQTPDKEAAFATLYEVLVDLTCCIAPFSPFVAEELYQNLVRPHDDGAAPSVHMLDYPQPSDIRVDEKLRVAMATTRTVVTLGQRVRSENKLKVRQPLGEAIAVVTDEDERKAVARFENAIREELNVHKLSFTSEPQKYVTFELLPNFKLLGKKLGKQMKACKAALASADAESLYANMQASGTITIDLVGQPLTLSADEVEVRLKAKDDYAAAAAYGQVLVLDTRISDGLRLEGLAREVVSRVQKARKLMDLAYEARISIVFVASDSLAEAISVHAATIAGETLATSIVPMNNVGESAVGTRHDSDVDGEEFTFYIAPQGN